MALGDELGAVQCAGDAVWAACCRREVLARPPTPPHNTAWRCGDVAPGPARPGRVPICRSTPQYVVTSILNSFHLLSLSARDSDLSQLCMLKTTRRDRC